MVARRLRHCRPVCRYHTAGTCQKGNACDMIHDDVAKKAHAALVRAGGASGDKPGGRGAAAGGGPSAAKGGGKGQPKAKAAPGPNGRNISTKGGNTDSKLPCYAIFEGKCKEATCRLNHRSLTPAEVVTYEAWKVTRASRAASPGAPASGVCPDFQGELRPRRPVQHGASRGAFQGGPEAGGEGQGQGGRWPLMVTRRLRASLCSRRR